MAEDDRVQAFDSIEAMFEYMEKQSAAANQRALPEQKAITFGQYFTHYDKGFSDLWIFGYIWSLEDHLQSWVKYLRANDNDPEITQEILYEIRGTLDSYDNNMRFGRCFSIVEPSGELGSTHVSSMLPIKPEWFQTAQENGWDIHRIDEPWAYILMHVAGDPVLVKLKGENWIPPEFV